MNLRAQGALEYLLLIGGAILVAAIVISLISATPSAADPTQKAKCLSQKSFDGCNAAGCKPTKSDLSTKANVASEFFICMASGTPSEICNNGIDDDVDSSKDCDDSDCWANPACLVGSGNVLYGCDLGATDYIIALNFNFETGCGGGTCLNYRVVFNEGPKSGTLYIISSVWKTWALLPNIFTDGVCVNDGEPTWGFSVIRPNP